jgi:hypothetical protein
MMDLNAVVRARAFAAGETTGAEHVESTFRSCRINPKQAPDDTPRERGASDRQVLQQLARVVRQLGDSA